MSDYLTGDVTSVINAINTSTVVSSIPDIYSACYDNCTINTSTFWPPVAKLETDSNELKINIKKSQIKFNFNL